VKIIFLGFLIFLFTSTVFGKGEDSHSDDGPPSIGNFILPSSQIPGPLLSFGQNIIDKNETIIYLSADDFQGADRHSIDAIPSILYGITDRLSIYLVTPIAVNYKLKQNSSSGLEDAFLQLEYAFYSEKNHDFTDQATIVTNMTFPTGSATKQPNTGVGSPSFFIGGTFNRDYINWFEFISDGAILTTTGDDNIKFGNQFLYQAGIGRNIFNIDTKWIFAWLLEADGTYAQKNKINGLADPNSGGNTIFLTPSLWVSSKTLSFQLGFGLPVVQHLFGNQLKNNYLVALSLGWSFYGK
jgi:hypothetical protein